MMNPGDNFLQFWPLIRVSEPQLYDLVMIVLATPATQVSVKRLFSGLRYIMSTLRANLREDITDSIMLIRSNFDLLHDTQCEKRSKTAKR